MRVALTFAAVLLLAHPAHADQCAWVDDAVAQRAVAILASQPKVIAFCEPCGEQAPGVPQLASTVELRSPEAGYQEVHLDGTPIDLAYTFVQTSASHYRNLAALAGCPAHGVSASLNVTDETPTGVLITAEGGAPLAAPRLTPPPHVPPPSPTVYVYSPTIMHELPWVAFLLACGGAGAFAALGVTMASARRRRRAMRPRAAELPLARQ